MYRHELTDEDATRLVAGAVRNNCTTQTIFSPYVSLHLRYVDGMLYRVSPQGTLAALRPQDEILDLSDEAIYQLVQGAA